MNEAQIKEVLKNSKTIAMIGVSSEKKGEDKNNLKRKPANIVMKYLLVPILIYIDDSILWCFSNIDDFVGIVNALYTKLGITMSSSKMYPHSSVQ